MLTTLLTMGLLHWLALITPGPNFLLISQLAASGHRGSACHASVGISVVAALWALLAILGVNGLFALHPALRMAVQIAGGFYLCHVAWTMWRGGSQAETRQSGRFAPRLAFRLGFFTNIMNPKSALFFGSVFAASLPAEPEALLLAAAVTLVFLNALIWHLLLALALSHRAVQGGYARQRRMLNRICAGIIGAFGLRLLVAAVSESGTR